MHHTGQGRRFIVEEDPPVFHLRGIADVRTGLNVEFVMGDNRHICPPIPGGNADFFAQIINTKNYAAAVITADHPGLFYAGKRARYRIELITFPLPGLCLNCKLITGNQFVHQRSLTALTNDDHVARKIICFTG